jgi:hypothetical protein
MTKVRERVRATRSPFREILLLAGIYLLYTGTRLAADDDFRIAIGHAKSILDFEKTFHIDIEASMNTALGHVHALEIFASYWYSTSHYLVTVITLVALYRWRPESYGWLRTSLVIATMIALAFYVLYPAAPPRLYGGYTDTLANTAHLGWWSDHASAPKGLGTATNELAAMPSMHVGWALWCTIVMIMLARHTWQRVLAVSYTVITALVVVTTANHWLLDLIVGWAVMLVAIAFGRSYGGRREPAAAERPLHGEALPG